MNSGMLWFMPKSPKPMNERVTDDGAHYARKYGRLPNECHMNPKDLGQIAGDAIQGITLRPDPAILPNHLWIGVSE